LSVLKDLLLFAYQYAIYARRPRKTCMKLLNCVDSRLLNIIAYRMNLNSAGLLAALCFSAAGLLLSGAAPVTAQNRTDGAGISGTITAALPDGASVSVIVSTDYFRNNSIISSLSFPVKGGVLSYNIPLPAPATYYIGAVGGALINGQHPAPGAPLGVFNDYAPVYLRPGADVSGADFSLAPDTSAPTVSIIYPSEGSILTTLDQIVGIAYDNIGVVSIDGAVQDLTTGLWWSGELGSWISNGSTPLYHDVYAVFSGAPKTPGWAVDTAGEAAESFSKIATMLAKGHNYRLYFRATDFANNLQPLPASVGFTWMVQPEAGLARQILGFSTATWRR